MSATKRGTVPDPESGAGLTAADAAPAAAAAGAGPEVDVAFETDVAAGAGRAGLAAGAGSAAGPFAAAPASGPFADPEAAILAAMTADLERIALEPAPKPSAGFADRVGAVIAREPAPVPMAAAGSAVRRHSGPGFAAALRDAVRVGFGSHRPATARAGAFAMLAVAALIVVSVGGALAFGAASVLAPAPRETHRTEQPSPSSTQPQPTLSTEPTVLPSPGEPTESAGSSPAVDNDGPGASPRETADSDESIQPGGTAKPSESPRDSDDPTASPSPRPSPTPHGSDGGH